MQGAPGIALHVVDTLEGISGSALFDRLIRGRVWIGLLAFALIGMVAMQLLVLKLNTGIGHTLERVAELQRQNAQLGIEDSTYSAEDRVAPLAAAAGMTLAPAGTVHFVAADPADYSRAASALATAVPTSTSGSSEATEASSGTSESSAAEAETAKGPTVSSQATLTGSKTEGSTESSSASGRPQGSAATAEAGHSTESSSSTSGASQETGTGTAETGGVAETPASASGSRE